MRGQAQGSNRGEQGEARVGLGLGFGVVALPCVALRLVVFDFEANVWAGGRSSSGRWDRTGSDSLRMATRRSTCLPVR